ncbi:hypothetical protein Stube_46330 [Streptomyces tubercidicus]|uniref:Uncharacterized protein n=1 Tax=Streptomyces tubercidicus TaxID=47759 RepID=A0A640UXB9_9ACTN|nr:hypothetical protein Stube_46330 [Streptomyces tubercidicus]
MLPYRGRGTVEVRDRGHPLMADRGVPDLGLHGPLRIPDGTVPAHHSDSLGLSGGPARSLPNRGRAAVRALPYGVKR